MMQPTDNTMQSSQWLFTIPALLNSPTVTTSNVTLQKELYDRARGVEFLFRLGSSLALSVPPSVLSFRSVHYVLSIRILARPSPAIFTAATWFHRFYMRYSMEDYHRQDVAATCIFLATKTEECGRKLRDVARVCQSKSSGIDIAKILPGSKEVEDCQNIILLTEEVLLEAICFDFVIGSPHAELVDLFDAYGDSARDYAWSMAHDSYRSPLCLLYPPRIIGIACYVLGQHMAEVPYPTSLDARLSGIMPSASLPTPSHDSASPDTTLLPNDQLALSKEDVGSVAEVLSILLEFYSAQDIQGSHPYVAPLAAVTPPTTFSNRPRFYVPANQIDGTENHANPSPIHVHSPTLNSSHGGSAPALQ